ncbi:MAG: hypothetical protein OER95_17210, partial [Acidimicrobiia bacterium]|nr:hypothetical protein [Acidimicrobiia bacterium]
MGLLFEVGAALRGDRMRYLRSTKRYLGAGLLKREAFRRTVVALFMVVLLAPIGLAAVAQDVTTALVATVDGPITPVTADYL